MPDLETRAAAVIGKTRDGISWPYGLSSPSFMERRKDPEAFEQRVQEQRARQESLVSWAEQHGLKLTDSGCCPLWLQRERSRRCNPDPERSSCTGNGPAAADRNWMDHFTAWLKDGRPAAIAAAPYELSAAAEMRLGYWPQHDPRLHLTRGAGWYGYATTQIVLWRADRLPSMTAAQAPEDFHG
ncbi:hypothetical protein [Streptomyces aureus]|uniref:hypothetical protein n=1 Tax=Streptomyces aureus TaxID=193461 RepID=UPI0036B0880B